MAIEELSRLEILLSAIGIDPDSFVRFVEWALSEQLVVVMSDLIKAHGGEALYSSPDALKKFRALLRTQTHRSDWSEQDLDKLFRAVKVRLETHYRDPIEYGEYLRLLWQVKHECAECKKAPPDVILHIDHIVPVTLGGSSKRQNLQFLCSKCNLSKYNKLKECAPWLELR